ncbi:MAG: SpoVG family protein [Paludibacteraceae bacterium]|nr:SpoVG family protein [Paludibacteraceae bacterium]
MPKKNTPTTNAPKQAAPKKTKLPSIDVRIDSLVDYEGSKTKAFASANIGGAFAIHGLRVMDSEKGLFVSMPSRKDGENYREVFHPVSTEAREELNKKVLAAYEQKLTEEQSQEQEETETLSEDETQAPVTQTM